MTAVYLFWKANAERIMNLAESGPYGVFDRNISISANNVPDEYVMEDQRKKILVKNGRPCFVKVAYDAAQEPSREFFIQAFGYRSVCHLMS